MSTITPRISFKRDPKAARAQNPDFIPTKVRLTLELGERTRCQLFHEDEFLLSTEELMAKNFFFWHPADLTALFGDEVNRVRKHNPRLGYAASLRASLIEFMNRSRGTTLTEQTAPALRVTHIELP